MEAIVESVKKMAAMADDAARKNIYDGLRELLFSIESPQEAVQRLMYSVSYETARTRQEKC